MRPRCLWPKTGAEAEETWPFSCGGVVPTSREPIVPPSCDPRPAGWTAISSPTKAIAAPSDARVDFGSWYGDGVAWTGREVLAMATLIRSPSGSTDYTYEAAPVAYAPSSDTWRAIPKPPGHRERTVWTGTLWLYLLDRSGTVDGYAFDPKTEVWATIPRAPLAAREAPAMAWATATKELIIWGGYVPYADPARVPASVTHVHADGAAYDPATGRWRTIAKSPLPGGWFVRAAWDGERLVLAQPANSVGVDDGGGELCDFPRAGSAAYDPSTDTWSPICEPPYSRRIARFAAPIADGQTVFFGGWGGSCFDGDGPPDFGDGVIFDSRTGMWATIPEGARLGMGPDHGGVPPMIWTANGKLYQYWGVGDSLVPEGGTVFDPITRAWSPLPFRMRYAAYDTLHVWTGCELIALTLDGGWRFTP